MRISNNVYILYIVGTAIYQWRWRNKIEIKISICLKEINVFINKIYEQSICKSHRTYGVTDRTNELTRSQITSNINLLIQWNEWNELIY